MIGVFTLVPLGSVAARVGAFSALCDALAAGALAYAVLQLGGSRAAAVLAAAAFAFAPPIWTYATVAEVFPLNNLFVAGALALVASPGTPLPVLAGWCGLGLANHHSFLLVAVPVLAAGVWRARPWSPRALGRAGLAFAAGALPYLYLAVAARGAAPVSWGDADSLSGFLAHVLRREYGTFQLATTDVGTDGASTGTAARFGLFATAVVARGGVLVPLLALVGLVAATRRGRLVAGAWVGALVLSVGVFVALANVRIDLPLHRTVLERFWQQPIVIVAALAGLGFAALVQAARLPGIAAGAIALGLGVASAVAGWHAQDRRGDMLLRDYAQGVLESLPPRALLLATSDETVGALWYARYVEGVRPDIDVLPTGQIASPWFPAHVARTGLDVVVPADLRARTFIDANLPRRPVTVLNRIPWLQSLEEAYSLWAVGPVERVLPKGAVPEPAFPAWVEEGRVRLARLPLSAAERRPEGTWERYLAANVAAHQRRFATSVAREMPSHGTDPAANRLYIAVLEPLAARADADPKVYKDLGIAWQMIAAREPSARGEMVKWWRRYLDARPSGDPDLPAIRAAVAAVPR